MPRRFWTFSPSAKALDQICFLWVCVILLNTKETFSHMSKVYNVHKVGQANIAVVRLLKKIQKQCLFSINIYIFEKNILRRFNGFYSLWFVKLIQHTKNSKLTSTRNVCFIVEQTLVSTQAWGRWLEAWKDKSSNESICLLLKQTSREISHND